MKKIGILELVASKATNHWQRVVAIFFNKQYVGITPQAIAVWCRQMGHRVHYATYYGLGDPIAKLPDDLDIVFICAHTSLAPLAYALSKVYQKAGKRTVIGGPHAKSFPDDCLRYFDIVVLECDEALIDDIVTDQFEPHCVVSSAKPYDDTPTLAERLPYIKATSFAMGMPYPSTAIPMLASVGCPYSCNFCIDWNSRYRALSTERLAEDLRYASEHFPGIKLAFHDPNFGVRFNETLSTFERLPPERRNPYIVESSLKMLNPERLRRLRDTNCWVVAPGIESWTNYSNKAGVGGAVNEDKLEQVVEHMHLLHQYIPYLQANFILGLDSDAGDQPFELTKEFARRTPFLWPYMNIPIAFGGTPLYDTYLKEGRILRTMPFSFYILPYLTFILKNYDPITYFEKMIDLHEVVISRELSRERRQMSASLFLKVTHEARKDTIRRRLAAFRAALQRLRTDAHFLAFHLGKTDVLPPVYANAYRRQLGKYAELMPIEESTPLLSLERAMPIVSPGASAVARQPLI